MSESGDFEDTVLKATRDATDSGMLSRMEAKKEDSVLGEWATIVVVSPAFPCAGEGCAGEGCGVDVSLATDAVSDEREVMCVLVAVTDGFARSWRTKRTA